MQSFHEFEKFPIFKTVQVDSDSIFVTLTEIYRNISQSFVANMRTSGTLSP